MAQKPSGRWRDVRQASAEASGWSVDEPAENVGPGRPPRHTRFKPGQSGNPNGRPKGSKNFATILQQQLRKKVTITVDGKPKRMAVQEVIARRLANDSMKGTTKAMELLIRLTSQIR